MRNTHVWQVYDLWTRKSYCFASRRLADRWIDIACRKGKLKEDGGRFVIYRFCVRYSDKDVSNVEW